MAKSVLDTERIKLTVIDDPEMAVDGALSSPAFRMGYNVGFFATLLSVIGVAGVRKYRGARRQLQEHNIPRCSMQELRSFRDSDGVCKKVELDEDTHQLYLCKSELGARNVCFMDVVMAIRKK